jgi:hypothetical protein
MQHQRFAASRAEFCKVPAQRLIESCSITKHVIHACNFGGIPAADVLIESGGIIEH